MDNEIFNGVAFQGREEFLSDLCNAWKLDGCVVFGIFGMKSVGKSRTVMEHVSDVKKVLLQEHNFRDVKIIDIDMRFIRTSKELYQHICKFLDCDVNPSSFQHIELHIRRFFEQFFIFVFDNCEYLIDTGIYDEFQLLIPKLATLGHNVHVYITSTEEIQFSEINAICHHQILETLNENDSKNVLKESAQNVDFGEHLDKIVVLCGGLPLALLMVGSELEADDGMLKPEDMVELLTECRLRALSREFYPKEDRIADVLKEFVRRLSELFQQRLATLGYIPGSFNAEQAMKIFDSDSGKDNFPMKERNEKFERFNNQRNISYTWMEIVGSDGHDSMILAKDEALIPLKKKNCITYDSRTERFDIHGILRDCLSVYVSIKDMPAVKRRFCKTFAEEIIKISHMMSNTDYAEAKASFNHEILNLKKLLTEVLYTHDDTYSYFIEVASTCSTLLENFLAFDSEKFYEGCLTKCQQYGKKVDEAVVKISYGSLLTNAKGDASRGEQFYCQALDILKTENPHGVKLAEVHQKFGWNLYIQGRPEESLKHLKSTLEIVQKLGQDRTSLCRLTLTYLGIVYTFIGDFVQAEKFHRQGRDLQRINLREENIDRDQNKKKQVTEDEMPAFGSIFNSLGVFYQQKGDRRKALKYHEKAMKINMQVKTSTRALLVSINNVAADYSVLGRLDEAAELLKKAEYIALRASPLNEINLGIIYDTMGKVANKMRHFSEAKRCLEKAVEIRSKKIPRSAMHAESILHLSQAEKGLKHFEKAKILAESVVAMKFDVVKSQPQNRFISGALECLLDICILNENGQGLQDIYEALEEEFQRLIHYHTSSNNERRVKQVTQRLQSIQIRISEKEMK